MSNRLRKDLPYPENMLFDIFEREIEIPADIDDAIHTVFVCLTERERNILILRYKGCETYEKIGKAYGLTRDRIRQITVKALRKLRHPNRARWLEMGYSATEAYLQKVEQEKQEREEIARDMAAKRAKEIEELDFSVRTFNCLKRAGLSTVNDVIAYGEENLHKIRNIGKKGVEEIKQKIFRVDGEAVVVTKVTEITEVCPNCESEITMQWDTNERGYKAFCPVCGDRLMLCSCCHDDTGECDYCTETDSCKFNPIKKGAGI